MEARGAECSLLNGAEERTSRFYGRVTLWESYRGWDFAKRVLEQASAEQIAGTGTCDDSMT
jgi:hypothetical protein